MPGFRGVLAVLRRCFGKRKLAKVTGVVLVWVLSVNLLTLLWLRPENNNEESSTKYELKTTQEAVSFPPFQDVLDGEENNTVSAGGVNFKPLKETFESLFDVVDSYAGIPTDSNGKFVLVIPHRMKNDKGSLHPDDRRASSIAGSVLNTLDELDSVACLPRKIQTLNSIHRETWKGLFNKTWCNFARREWSIQIRNSGRIKYLKFQFKGMSELHNNVLQLCNLYNGPFIMRKEKFMKLKGLRQDFGRLSFLDFFLRSKGQLKLGKFGNCFFSDELFYADRGNLEGSGDFPEYSHFGLTHGVFRIIMEDRIEWTRCVATDKHCKEEPYIQPITLPQIGQPICCSVVLAKMLKDIVAVFTKLGIKYRLLYGTLLGAERSGAIIPYTFDIDLTTEYKICRNSSSYDALQIYFTDKYHISSKSFMGMPRLIPLMPPHLNIKTSDFFNGELDLQGDSFFSPEIVKSIQGLLPFHKTDWRTRGYADFYPGWDLWWNGSSTVFIDGDEYLTVKEKYYELENWYGKDWKTPIVKWGFNSQTDLGNVVG